MRTLLIAFCLLSATGCDENSPTGPPVPLNERFTLAPAQVGVIEELDLGILFVAVSGDSRCPADAVCIQGGDAIVHVRALDDEGVREYELHTGDSSRASALHRGARIELVELQPYPFSSRTIAPEEYRAVLLVRRP